LANGTIRVGDIGAISGGCDPTIKDCDKKIGCKFEASKCLAVLVENLELVNQRDAAPKNTNLQSENTDAATMPRRGREQIAANESASGEGATSDGVHTPVASGPFEGMPRVDALAALNSAFKRDIAAFVAADMEASLASCMREYLAHLAEIGALPTRASAVTASVTPAASVSPATATPV
jgi:hypothetical protein